MIKEVIREQSSKHNQRLGELFERIVILIHVGCHIAFVLTRITGSINDFQASDFLILHTSHNQSYCKHMELTMASKTRENGHSIHFHAGILLKLFKNDVN